MKMPPNTEGVKFLIHHFVHHTLFHLFCVAIKDSRITGECYGVLRYMYCKEILGVEGKV